MIKDNYTYMIGKRFDHLVVESYAGIEGKRTRWVCRCDCGNTVVKSAKELWKTNGGVKSCGCIVNKRGVDFVKTYKGTHIEQIRNTNPTKRSQSGHKGVYYEKQSGTWKVEIMVQGKRHYLGRYEQLADAVKARKDAEELYQMPLIDEFDKQNGSAVGES